MRLLNTAGGGTEGFIRRAHYEIKHAYPQPDSRSGQTGPEGYLLWHWSSHHLILKVQLKTKRVMLVHSKLVGGMFETDAVRDSKGVRGVFYMMFDLLGNDDQAMRVLTEPYKGP